MLFRSGRVENIVKNINACFVEIFPGIQAYLLAILYLDRYADELLAVSDVPGVEAVLAIRQVGGDGTLVGDASIGVSSDRGEIRVLKVLVVHEDRHGLARGEAGEVDIEGLGVIWLVLNDGWD